MRVISSFQDYYDSARGYGLDPKLVYRREMTALADAAGLPLGRGREEIWWPRYYRPRDVPRLEKALWHLAFCGRVHPLVVLDRIYSEEQCERSYCWSVDDVLRGLTDFPEEAKAFVAKRRKWGAWGRPFTRPRVEAVFDEVVDGPGVLRFHRHVEAPVALLRGMDRPLEWAPSGELVLNPVLKELEFYRVVDAFTAFQEISMYLGGVMGMPEEIHAPIPDDALRDMKGFDDRSFKTDSPGKKRRRRGLS